MNSWSVNVACPLLQRSNLLFEETIVLKNWAMALATSSGVISAEPNAMVNRAEYASSASNRAVASDQGRFISSG